MDSASAAPSAPAARGIRQRLHAAIYDPMRGLNPDMALAAVGRLVGWQGLAHASIRMELARRSDLEVARAFRLFDAAYPAPHAHLTRLARLAADR